MLSKILPYFKEKETEQERESYSELSSIGNFSTDLQKEIVREGELKVASQFTSLQIAQRRGYSLSSILLTFAAAATTSLSITTLNTSLIPTIATVGFSLAAGFSVLGIWPTARNTPGNDPKNWLQKHWEKPPRKKYDDWIRVEQCKVIQCVIDQNRRDLKLLAFRQRWAITLALITSVACAITFLIKTAG